MKKTRQLLISLLTLLCCSTGAWAQNQDGEGNYLIGSVQDWKAFATLVQTEPTANARMIADIDLGDDQTTVGTQDVPYAGTFDGNGHTLTVAYSQNIHGLAPFRYINGATIQRIHITGTIDTQTGKCAAGIVSYSTGGTTTISECWSSAKLKGDDTMGGICAVIQDGTMNINDCLVDGTISGSIAFNGGFISYPENTATVNINNGLFLRYADADVYWSGTFFRSDQDWFGPRNLYNCYYFYPYGYPQGIQATEEQLANGETARALQAGRPEQVWVQDMDMGQPMLKVFATEQEPSGMFCYIYNHDTQTATVTYLRDSDSNKKGGTYVGDVVIPAKAPNGYDVTVIGEDAFYNCPEMTSLTIPATIDSIGCEPFAESGAQLTKITIEDGDTPIRCHVRDAWPMGCYPVFGRYVNVEELYIGRNYSSFVSRGWVEAVYEGSWSLIRDSEHLKKVTLGNVFTEVPYAMFYGCTQLQEVNINPNAKSVGKEAFSRCEALTTIDLPEGIETIDEEAFCYCKALEHIGLPKTLGVIGGNAFTNCDAFSSFTIPASVDSIGANILADCDNLKRIDIAYSSEPLKYYCPSQFQNSLRSAPIDTLYTDRYIDGALSDNRTLKKLYIGPNVTALHDYNFSDCYNIDEVFSLNPEPPTCEGSSVFYSGTKQSATLHVPIGSLDAYKEAYIWKDFFNIIDDIGSDEPCEPTLTQEKLYATRLSDMGTARICHQIMGSPV